MGKISGDYSSSDLTERLSELKSIASYIDYFIGSNKWKFKK